MTVAAVTVVVPTIGRRELLAQCLRSLADARPAADDLVIVDQSEAGVAAEVAANAGITARVVEMAREGVGAAANAGLRAAGHDHVLLTHDDCRVDPSWVGVGADLLAEHPREIHTGAVLPDGGGTGHVPSTITSAQPALYRGAPRADVLYPNCMAISVRAARTVAGFDPRLVIAEDNDLCFRWMRAGGAVRYTPGFRVWHADWRDHDELRDLYRAYWTAQGIVIGKHLRARHREIVPILRDNVAWAARGTLHRRVRRRTTAPDATFGGLTRLPVGMLRGWRMEGRSAAPQDALDRAG